MASKQVSVKSRACFLCPAHGCTNNDPDQFEERSVCEDTEESAEVMVCLVCKEECSKDEWDFTKEALFPPTRSFEGLDLDLGDSDKDEPPSTRSDVGTWDSNDKQRSSSNGDKSSFDPTVIDELGYLGLDQQLQEEVLFYSELAQTPEANLQANNAGSLLASSGLQVTDQLSNDAMADLLLTEDPDGATAPKDFPTVHSDIPLPEGTDISRDFSTESLNEVISASQCLKCSGPLVKIPKLDNIWHCESCDDCIGFDDSMSMRDVYGLMQVVAESLEHATLRIKLCPGGCGNDDINKFILAIQDGDLMLRCSVCKHQYKIPDTQENCNSQQIENAPREPPKEEIGLRCKCGNESADAFALHYNKKHIPYKLTCHVCDEEQALNFGNSADDQDEWQIFYALAKGRTEIKSIDQIETGDHIAQHQDLGYWHHMIVSKVGELSRNVQVIHYSGPEKAYAGKGVIKQEWLSLDPSKESLYRWDYDQSLPTEEVIQRAESRLGEAEYSLCDNNCEHFATWCKTARAISEQVESFAETVDHIRRKISALAGKDCVKQAIQVINFAASSEALKDAAKTTVESLRGAAKTTAGNLGKLDYAAMGLVLGIEAYRTGRNIYQMHQKKEKGDISQAEFIRFTVKRSTQGVGGAAGTIAGGMVGQFLIPVPVLGSLVGSTVGACVGEALGAYLGRQVVKQMDGK